MTDLLDQGLAGATWNAGLEAGEENPTSATKGRRRVTENSTPTTVDLSTDAPPAVSSAPARLYGIYVNTVLSAHAVEIRDDATMKITLPASLAAGTLLRFPAVRFETSLLVVPNASSTGNITLFWEEI